MCFDQAVASHAPLPCCCMKTEQSRLRLALYGYYLLLRSTTLWPGLCRIFVYLAILFSKSLWSSKNRCHSSGGISYVFCTESGKVLLRTSSRYLEIASTVALPISPKVLQNRGTRSVIPSISCVTSTWPEHPAPAPMPEASRQLGRNVFATNTGVLIVGMLRVVVSFSAT